MRLIKCIIFLLITQSCSQALSHEETVSLFLDYSSRYRYEKAAQLLTPDSRDEYQSLIQFYQSLPDSIKENLPVKLQQPRIVYSEVDGLNAVVVTEIQVTSASNMKIDSFFLQSINNIWKINFHN